MSHVTDIVLVTSVVEPDQIFQTINEWLDTHGYQYLEQVDNEWKGAKATQLLTLIGAYNAFYNIDEFIRYVMSISWFEPESIVLIVRTEDEALQVHRLR